MTSESPAPSPGAALPGAAASRWRRSGVAAALTGAAVLLLLAFHSPGLDLAAARLFHFAGSSDPWPIARLPFWRAVYAAAPVLVGVHAALGASAVLVGLFARRSRALLATGVYLLLCLALGPGLLVNGVLKGTWGRPRPLELREFGGQAAFSPAHLQVVPRRGKSFPSGHASVGFVFSGLFFALRERRPRAAWLVLAGSVILGAALGVARMAAGTHFLSDILWSGVITVGVCAALAALTWPVLALKPAGIPGGEAEEHAGAPMLRRGDRG